MAAEVASLNICSTAGCGKSATLQCPTCLKLGIQSSYFCNQVGHGFSQCTLERSSVVHPAPLSLPLHVRSVLRGRGRSTEWCTRRPELVCTSLYCSTTHASVFPTLPPPPLPLTATSNSTYNPWPQFAFTGPLRPRPVVSVTTPTTSW